jgi:hypothetical protein
MGRVHTNFYKLILLQLTVRRQSDIRLKHCTFIQNASETSIDRSPFIRMINQSMYVFVNHTHT